MPPARVFNLGGNDYAEHPNRGQFRRRGARPHLNHSCGGAAPPPTTATPNLPVTSRLTPPPQLSPGREIRGTCTGSAPGRGTAGT